MLDRLTVPAVTAGLIFAGRQRIVVVDENPELSSHARLPVYSALEADSLDALRIRRNAVRDLEAATGIETFKGFPDYWFDDYHSRCTNGHVSTRILMSEERGDLCLACRAPVLLTYPTDSETPVGELVGYVTATGCLPVFSDDGPHDGMWIRVSGSESAPDTDIHRDGSALYSSHIAGFGDQHAYTDFADGRWAIALTAPQYTYTIPDR